MTCKFSRRSLASAMTSHIVFLAGKLRPTYLICYFNYPIFYALPCLFNTMLCFCLCHFFCQKIIQWILIWALILFCSSVLDPFIALFSVLPVLVCYLILLLLGYDLIRSLHRSLDLLFVSSFLKRLSHNIYIYFWFLMISDFLSCHLATSTYTVCCADLLKLLIFFKQNW